MFINALASSVQEGVVVGAVRGKRDNHSSAVVENEAHFWRWIIELTSPGYFRAPTQGSIHDPMPCKILSGGIKIPGGYQGKLMQSQNSFLRSPPVDTPRSRVVLVFMAALDGQEAELYDTPRDLVLDLCSD